MLHLNVTMRSKKVVCMVYAVSKYVYCILLRKTLFSMVIFLVPYTCEFCDSNRNELEKKRNKQESTKPFAMEL